MDFTTKPNHLGRKISKIRELRGMKQEALAMAIGVSQQTVSTIENSEEVDEKVLLKIAQALEVIVEAVKNFNEDAMINYFNSFNDADFSNSNGVSFGSFGPSNCNFNPLDKLIEAYEENKELYKQLLQAEKDKVAYLEQLRK